MPQSSQTVQLPLRLTRMELQFEHCSPVYPLVLASYTFVSVPPLPLAGGIFAEARVVESAKSRARFAVASVLG